MHSPLLLAYGFGIPADIVVSPNSYTYVIDVPRINGCQVQVQLEQGKYVLLISCERKRSEVKKAEQYYARQDRKVCKLIQKFVLPEDANTDVIKEMVCDDGVLIVTGLKIWMANPKMLGLLTSLLVQTSDAVLPVAISILCGVVLGTVSAIIIWVQDEY